MQSSASASTRSRRARRPARVPGAPVAVRAAAEDGELPLPPHRALAIPALHASPRKHSVAAGETLEICLSASVPYRLSICRLGATVDDASGDTVLTRFAEESPRPHPIHPGS